jgi:hypothetical protein
MSALRLPSPSESAFLEQVLTMAGWYGWRTFHVRPARTLRGWRTPIEGSGVGFPDIVAVKPPVVLFCELKSDNGKPTPQQEKWLACLAECREVRTKIFRPSDLDKIACVLSGG